MSIRKRPELAKGDVCRLHKNARRRYSHLKNATFVVAQEPRGDSAERSTYIDCTVTYTNFGQKKVSRQSIKREYLWFTGYNNQTGTKKVSHIPLAGYSITPSNIAPKNNDGRSTCLKCGQPTINRGGYQVCHNQSCSWFDN